MPTSVMTSRISPSSGPAIARRLEQSPPLEVTTVSDIPARAANRMTRHAGIAGHALGHAARRGQALRGRRAACAGLALAILLLCAGCASRPAPAQTPFDAGPPAHAATPESVGMVDIRQLVPDIDLDIRYAGPRNFTGGRVEGYGAAKCYLLRPAAEALRNVEVELRGQGLRLRIFDCYRPARAVRQFVDWAADPGDQSTKAEYYPALDKASLVPGYIADRSGHSKGATVDLTLLR